MPTRRKMHTSWFCGVSCCLFGVALASCSGVSSNVSMFDRLAQPSAPDLKIDSTPQGAEARTSFGTFCQTPCQLPVPVTDEFTVTYSLDGYLPQTVPVRPVPVQKTALIDTTPPELSPNPVSVELTRAPPPPPPPPPTPTKKRQRP